MSRSVFLAGIFWIISAFRANAAIISGNFGANIKKLFIVHKIFTLGNMLLNGSNLLQNTKNRVLYKQKMY